MSDKSGQACIHTRGGEKKILINQKAMEQDKQNNPAPSHQRRRDDGPKLSISQELEKRIKGLEQIVTEPGHTPQDIAALERTIAKLKSQLEYVNTTIKPK